MAQSYKIEVKPGDRIYVGGFSTVIPEGIYRVEVIISEGRGGGRPVEAAGGGGKFGSVMIASGGVGAITSDESGMFTMIAGGVGGGNGESTKEPDR